MTEHRSFLDKFLGSSLHLFHTATSRYNNFREPEQKVLYVNAGMAEGCTVQQLNDVVRHMENYICQFDEVDMFRTRITSYDNARIEITFKPEYENSGFPSMLKQELTSAAINFGGATWRVWGIDDNSFNNNIVSSYRSNQIRLRGYNYDQLAAYADRLIDSCLRTAASPNRRSWTATHGHSPTTNSRSATTTNESQPQDSTSPTTTRSSTRCFISHVFRRFTTERNCNR